MILVVMIIIINIVILIDGLNFSFDAILAIYMNNTNIPLSIVIIKIYENQNDPIINPVVIEMMIVCAMIVIPIAKGCFSVMNIIDNIVIMMNIIVISVSSLI